MALEKELIIKGYPVTYWHIYDLHYNKQDNTTRALVVGYLNKALRDQSLENFFPNSQLLYPFAGRLNEADIYPILMQPIIRRTVTRPAIEQELSATGDVLVEAEEAQFIDEDINVLSGAVRID